MRPKQGEKHTAHLQVTLEGGSSRGDLKPRDTPIWWLDSSFTSESRKMSPWVERTGGGYASIEKGESTELAPRAVMKCHQAERHHFLAPNLGRSSRGCSIHPPACTTVSKRADQEKGVFVSMKVLVGR